MRGNNRETDTGPCIYRVYDQIKQERAQSGEPRRLKDVLLSPAVLEVLRATTYRPLPPEQLEINRRGYDELAKIVATLT